MGQIKSLNISYKSESKEHELKTPKTPELPDLFWFFKPTSLTKGEWKIDHLRFVKFLIKNGFRRMDIGKEYIFILILNKIINEVTITEIQDFVIFWIESADKKYFKIDEEENDEEEIDENETYQRLIKREELINKFYTSPGTYFNEKKLSLLGNQPDLNLRTDTKDKCFIYFENGFVEVSAENYQLKKYNELFGYIFKKQIKDRPFHKHSEDGMFEKFVRNICKNDERYIAFRTMIGYLLHGFFDTKMKAVNLTDSTISDVSEGRTGKTLIGHAISQIKNITEISGKDFDPSNKHKYSAASLDTQIIFLNDLRKNFLFENLFNDISDAITVDRKNMQPFTIRAKMLIASNDTFQVDGASAKDRVIEFELSDYYGSELSPADEFGCWFFTEWDENEWLAFDNWMMKSISLYLQNGVIEAAPINLYKRKQIQFTNKDFVEFIDDLIKKEELKNGKEYNKKELHEQFLDAYPEYRDDRQLQQLRNFTKYLKVYATNSSILSSKFEEKRSNGKSFIKFIDAT